ncbi:MAG: histidinol-phosphate transaminase [Kiritimatiellae bacterium]|nr:histidinol-phosphate transaminase [Kiritimatiellia bacterium]
MIPIPDRVRRLAVYEPGRPIEEVAREQGFADAAGIVKLASNENALGPSPRARRAIRAAAVRAHLYPDGGAFALREALARRFCVPPDCVAVGHGSNELIALLAQALLEPGDSIVASQCAFVVYRLVAELFGARTIETPMRAFTHDLDAMAGAVEPRTKLIFVANPNNPTGTMVGAEEIDRLIRRTPSDVLVVLDEAYIELLPPERQPDTIRYVREGRPVMVLRTFSKTYGLAGLRIGYGLGPPEVVDALNRVRQPFNVNSVAQAAALAALEDEEHVERTRRMVAAGLAQWAAGCRRLGLETVPSVANFLLVRVGCGRAVFEALQRRGVIVRPMDGYGLPEYVRVTVGTRRQNRVALRALAEVIAQGVRA